MICFQPRKRLRDAALLSVLALSTPLALGAEVHLNGEGKVRYQPDSARLQFTLSAEHAEASQATDEVRVAMNRWREAIEGFRDQLVDYSDARLNLYQRQLPVEDRNAPRETVAVAQQTVSFEIHDLELLNPVLEQAQALGMTYNLGSHSFFHSREDELRNEALAGAIADARSRCEFTAQELGMRCNKVKSISLDGNRGPVPVMMAQARMDSAVETVSEIGPREVSVSVSATFEMK